MPSIEFINLTHLAELAIAPGCVLLLALIIGLSLDHFLKKRLKNRINVERTSFQYVFGNALKGMPVSICLVIALYWIVSSTDIIPPLMKFFSYLLFAVIVFTITRIIARTAAGMIDLRMERSNKNAPKTSLLTNILYIIIYAMGVLVVLQYYGISIAPILTALGVGGMAVALGLQETMANIFSGLHLIISKQLHIHDYIRLSSGEEGRVTDITWRFTTIVPANNGNMVVIPNQKIASSIITNYSLPRKDIVITIPVGVAYDSDLEYVEKVTLEVAKEVMARVDSKISIPPAVRFYAFGDSSIDFNVILHSSKFDHQYELKHEFIKALTKRYREENIEIPYPIRTVYNQNLVVNG